MRKPAALKSGDRVAAVSLSWGGAAIFPGRYEIGKQRLQDEFGIEIVEMPNTLRDADWLARNPKARAEDLMEAFVDTTINGIISVIGGDDSIRILPYVDVDVLSHNPKVFIGYSDTTVTHLACLRANLVSFYGPAVMAGFAENGGMHRYLVDSFRQILFEPQAAGALKPNDKGWTVEFLDWGNSQNQDKQRALTTCEGWKFLQGRGVQRGRLIGGCFEALEWFRGTEWWPSRNHWEGAILFWETSEEAIPPVALTRALRAYASLGILDEIHGILLGRPGGQIAPDRFEEYDEAILKVVRDELQLINLPVVTRMDFGHTDPIMTLPIGVLTEIDCNRKKISILEAAVQG